MGRGWNRKEITWKVDKNGCWICISHKGEYPIKWYKGRQHPVSHIMYEKYIGPIPKGLWVLHHCDNTKCINPGHLFLGTNQDNIIDMIKKGRDRKALGKENGRSKITVKQVRKIRKSNLTTRKLSKIHGISSMQVSCIKRKLVWKWVT